MSFFHGLMTESRARELTDFAEFVWEEYSVNGRLDPLQMFEAKGITYTFADYEDCFDGMLEYENGAFHVYLNQHRLIGIGRPRTRFTASHELGHYFIDEHRNGLIAGTLARHGSFAGYQSDELIEVEADHFASHLLMPASLFAQKAADEPLGFEGIRKIAAAFGTSNTAAGVRYVKLDILPCALFNWEGERLRWKLLSHEFYNAGFKHSIKKGDQPPSGSGTEEVLTSLVKPTGVVRRGTSANAWFPNIPIGSYKNEIFVEEVISVGKRSALSLLYRPT